MFQFQFVKIFVTEKSETTLPEKFQKWKGHFSFAKQLL